MAMRTNEAPLQGRPALLLYILSCCLATAHGAQLRRDVAGQLAPAAKAAETPKAIQDEQQLDNIKGTWSQAHGAGQLAPAAKAAETPKVDYKVLNSTQMVATPTEDCICPEGFFWHWRLKECIEKGGPGYECGFFPEEHHKYVCHEGLVCKKLKQKRKTQMTYFHPGAVPATCRHCAPEDNCKKPGEGERECIKMYRLSGESCATIEVYINATDSGEAALDGKSVGHSCVGIDDVKKELGIKVGGKVGSVLAAKVIFKASFMSYDNAYKAAIKAAKAEGKLREAAEAKAMAEKKAAADAQLQAESRAAQEAAKKVEDGTPEEEAAKAAKQAEHDAAAAEAAKKAEESAKAQEASKKAEEAADAAKAAEAAKAAKAAELAKAAEAAKASDDAAAAKKAADAAKKAAEAAEAAKAAAVAAKAKEAAKAAEAAKAKEAAKAAKAAAPKTTPPPSVADVVMPTPAPVYVKAPEEPKKPRLRNVPADEVDNQYP